MTENEYMNWLESTISNYAKSLAISGQYSEIEAAEEAKEAFYLKEGLSTPNLFTVENVDGIPVGVIWHTEDPKCIFILDFLVNEEYRRMGYGYAMLIELERILKERNIKSILQNGKKVGIRATISGINLREQKEMIDYFISLGVSCAFADLICLPIMKGNGIYNVNSEDYIDEFIKAKKYAESKDFFYSNFYMVNFDEPVTIACRAMIPMPHAMPSGYISACDMVTDITGSLLDVMLYGKYNDQKNTIEYDHNKIELIRKRNVDNMTLCSDCFVKQNCAGGCAGEAINETGDLFGVKDYLCKITRALANEFGVNHVELFPYLHP